MPVVHGLTKPDAKWLYQTLKEVGGWEKEKVVKNLKNLTRDVFNSDDDEEESNL